MIPKTIATKKIKNHAVFSQNDTKFKFPHFLQVGFRRILLHAQKETELYCNLRKLRFMVHHSRKMSQAKYFNGEYLLQYCHIFHNPWQRCSIHAPRTTGDSIVIGVNELLSKCGKQENEMSWKLRRGFEVCVYEYN